MQNNVFLDQYTVEGVPPAPAGVEKVAVTFTYDVNGILDVRTKIVSTGKEARLGSTAAAAHDGDRARGREGPHRRGVGKGPVASARPRPPAQASPSPGRDRRRAGARRRGSELRALARAARSRRGAAPAVADRLATLAAELDSALDRAAAPRLGDRRRAHRRPLRPRLAPWTRSGT